MTAIYLIFVLILLVGCSTKQVICPLNITYVDVVTVKETIIEKECTIQTITSDCKDTVCKETKCDNRNFLNCQMQLGQMKGEIDNYKTVVNNYLVNSTIDDLQYNLTKCKNDLNITETMIDKIEKLIN